MLMWNLDDGAHAGRPRHPPPVTRSAAQRAPRQAPRLRVCSPRAGRCEVSFQGHSNWVLGVACLKPAHLNLDPKPAAGGAAKARA